MIRIRLEQFPPGTIRKFHARGAGPFKVLKKVRSIAYVIDLPADYDFSSTSNVSDLVAYKEPIMIPSDPFEPIPSFESEPPTKCPQVQVNKKHGTIECLLDEQTMSTRRRDYHHYLVRWQERPESKDSWITQEEL